MSSRILTRIVVLLSFCVFATSANAQSFQFTLQQSFIFPAPSETNAFDEYRLITPTQQILTVWVNNAVLSTGECRLANWGLKGASSYMPLNPNAPAQIAPCKDGAWDTDYFAVTYDASTQEFQPGAFVGTMRRCYGNDAASFTKVGGPSIQGQLYQSPQQAPIC